MEERFADEFVTWHHKTPVGIKIDEVFGMDSRSGRVWRELARQIYYEQGEPDYRYIGHFENGAPFLEGYPGRISVSHTDHLFVVATLPKTPEVNLDTFNPRSAMGIDAEKIDRGQVLKVRSKFLSPEELQLVPENDIARNIQAWTVKEALYKAALCPGIDFANNLRIISLPDIDPNPVSKGDRKLGEAIIKFSDSQIGEQPMKIYSYYSYGCCVSIVFSPKCAKFGNK